MARTAGLTVASAASHAANRVRNADWDTWDAAAGIAAGVAGTAVDMLLVRLPEDTSKHHATPSPDWSPFTVWLNGRAEGYVEKHAHELERLEDAAKVPYDSDQDDLVLTPEPLGLSSAYHRLMGLGHDPVLGWLVGTWDLTQATGTYADDQGHLHRSVHYTPYRAGTRGPIDALRIQRRHLVSDMYSREGLPAPLLSLVQLARFPSPFILPLGDAERSGRHVSSSDRRRKRAYWSGVARYMYRHGYGARHFLTMSTVPLTVEFVGWTYWVATGRLRPARTRNWGRRSSILATGHAVAVAGNAVKTRVIYDNLPTALNSAELMAATLSVGAWAATRQRKRGSSTILDGRDGTTEVVLPIGAEHAESDLHVVVLAS